MGLFGGAVALVIVIIPFRNSEKPGIIRKEEIKTAIKNNIARVAARVDFVKFHDTKI